MASLRPSLAKAGAPGCPSYFAFKAGGVHSLPTLTHAAEATYALYRKIIGAA